LARPRTFDEQDVVERAMLQFWREGYGGTSISTLEESTGISRISLYNAFGDKDGLFLKALSLYREKAQDYFLDPQFAEGGLASIEALFSSISTKLPKDAPQQFGCLMLNTILDIDSVSDDAKEMVKDCRSEMIAGFRAALRFSSEAGEAIATKNEIDDRAEFLVGAMWGARISARLNGDVRAGAGVARTVMDVVKSWRTQR